MMLAQAVVDVPWHFLPPWLFGFIAFLAVVLLALMVIYYIRKIFGRRPPIEDVMEGRDKRLRGEIYQTRNSLRKELGDRLHKVEESVEEIRVDRERKWAALQNQYSELRGTIDYMRGRFDALLKKLENS